MIELALSLAAVWPVTLIKYFLDLDYGRAFTKLSQVDTVQPP